MDESRSESRPVPRLPLSPRLGPPAVRHPAASATNADASARPRERPSASGAQCPSPPRTAFLAPAPRAHSPLRAAVHRNSPAPAPPLPSIYVSPPASVFASSSSSSVLQGRRQAPDVLDDAPAGLVQAGELVAEHRRKGRRAVFCGGRHCVLLLAPGAPQWLFAWLPRVVLCRCMSATAVVAALVEPLCCGFGHELRVAALALETGLGAPGSGALVAEVWSARAVRLTAFVDVHAPTPPAAALPELAARREQWARLIRAGHALAAGDFAACAAVLRLGADRVEERLERGPGLVAMTPERMRQRCRLVGAFLRRLALDQLLAEPIGNRNMAPAALGVDSAEPDVTLVLAAPDEPACAERVAQLVRASEAAALAEADVPLPARPVPQAQAQAHPPAAPGASPIDVSDAWCAALELAACEPGAACAPPDLDRAADAVEQVGAVDMRLVCQLAGRAEGVVVGCDAGVGPALESAHAALALELRAATYPVRVPLAAFAQRYQPLAPDDLLAAVDDSESVAGAVCSAVCGSDEGLWRVGPSGVLMRESVREELDARLCELADAPLRNCSGVDVQWLQRAFPDEYEWLRAAWQAHQGLQAQQPGSPTPRSARAGAAPTADQLGSVGAAGVLERAFTRLGGRQAFVVCVRLMRALGWLELGALERAVASIGTNAALGFERRIQILVALAGAAAVCSAVGTASPHCRWRTDVVRGCGVALTAAVEKLARLHAPREARLLVSETPLGRAAAGLGGVSLYALSSNVVAFAERDGVLNADALVDALAPAIDAEAANYIAATYRAAHLQQRIFLTLEHLQLSELGTRLPRVTQVLRVLASAPERLATVGTGAAPLLRPEWVTAVADGSPLAQTVRPCAPPALPRCAAPDFVAPNLQVQRLADACGAPLDAAAAAALLS